MVEIYKEVARFRADIRRERTGEIIPYRAVVLEGPNPGQFHIDHSHTLRATETAIGFWYSNSHTSAPDLVTAEYLVWNWAECIEDAYEIGPWTDLD